MGVACSKSLLIAKRATLTKTPFTLAPIAKEQELRKMQSGDDPRGSLSPIVRQRLYQVSSQKGTQVPPHPQPSTQNTIAHAANPSFPCGRCWGTCRFGVGGWCPCRRGWGRFHCHLRYYGTSCITRLGGGCYPCTVLGGHRTHCLFGGPATNTLPSSFPPSFLLGGTSPNLLGWGLTTQPPLNFPVSPLLF